LRAVLLLRGSSPLQRGIARAPRPYMDQDSEHHDVAELESRIRRWIADDPDPACRLELEDLLAAGDWAALSLRFGALLQFGTAGLRGPIGAGPSCMNRAVVARATAGLCAHLNASVNEAARRGICIGFDARHMSRALAEETAAVAAGAGFRTWLFEAEVATPVLAFAVLELSAAAGVMITASHNPASDNGYKVYWENGAQLIPPHDGVIAAHMQAISSTLALPRLGRETRRRGGREVLLGGELEQRYLDGVSASNLRKAPRNSGLIIAYTALHGVGERFVRAALARAGLGIESVAEQASPDPDFPSVTFPNPEEPGAMDMVCALAQRLGADLAIANDPDADRLAVAARDRDGRLRTLTGNELGALLAEHRLRVDDAPGARLVLSSIVSSPMIAAIAQRHGAIWEPTLTGFKWICNRALQLERERGARFVFGFEEALGYCVGTLVRDKDGISTAVEVASLAACLREDGRTLHDLLEALFRAHGVHRSTQLSLRVEGSAGLSRIRAWMAGARSHPPDVLGGHRLRAVVDLLDGSVRGEPSFRAVLPASDALLWELEGGQRIMLRPSGTEPKLKAYLDVRVPVSSDEAIEDVTARADGILALLASALRDRLS
jgi:phosphomannomutase